MTTTELKLEHRHIYLTRLGMMEAEDPPTSDQHNLAVDEADEHVRRLKNTGLAEEFEKLRRSL